MDSAEEAVVVVSGRARVIVAEETREAPAGSVVLIPTETPHEVHSTGGEPLRFIALYAGDDVITTYERDVQPSATCSPTASAPAVRLRPSAWGW